jgi:tetratricopeptide (TPR) repeat protein
MKASVKLLTLTLFILTMAFEGFQCGSPELEGAKVYRNQKNYQAAIEQLKKETAKNPSNEEAWYLLGDIYFETNDLENMSAAFSECLRIDPNKHGREIRIKKGNKWAEHINKGVGYVERGSQDNRLPYDSAVSEFNKAISAWPDTFITHRYVAIAYFNKNDFDNAVKSYAVAWNLAKQSDDAQGIGKIFLSRGIQNKANFETINAEKLRFSKEIDGLGKGTPRSEVLRVLGTPESKKPIKGTRKEDWIYAKYSLTLSFEGDNVSSRKFSKPFDAGLDSTEMTTARLNYVKAGEWLEKARAINPKDNEVLRYLLQVYVETGKTKEAIATYTQASANDPSNKVIKYILGHLYRSDNQNDNAVSSFEAALKLDENFEDALMELGVTYYNWGVEVLRAAQEKNTIDDSYKKQFTKAIPYFEKYTELKTNDAQVWETLANIYGRLGQSEKAMKAIERADAIRKGNQ